jgi:4-hydroxy-3-methylbut-2-en-1-yl diphosphate synthase IspG/GcpE
MSRDGIRVTIHKAQVARAIDEGVRDAIDKVSAKTLANAIRIVPIRSGKLRSSLRREVAKNGKEAFIGSALPYAKHVEQGTSKQAAQPYLKPSLYQARGSA